MSHIAIIYHSGYGHTEVVAKAVADGVTSAGGTPELLKIEKADQDFAAILEAAGKADAIIFGAPTYMGAPSAPFKAFSDASSKAWFTQAWKDKIAAGFTNSGNLSGDKLHSLVQMALLAAQHSMIWVGNAEMPNSGYKKPVGDPTATNRMGSSLGVMTQADQAAPEITPPEGDKETARLLGARVATITAQFLKGRG